MNFFKIVLTAISIVSTLSLNVNAETLHVYGWPKSHLPSGKNPDFSLGSDPVVGALSCLPFSRLDLIKGSSLPVIFSQIHEKKSADGSIEWSFEISANTALRWWSGETISSKPFVNFLQENLAKIVAEKGLKLWNAPGFEIKAINDKKFSVVWQKQPTFGPYILNGVAPWRSAKSSFECVGTFSLEDGKNELVLKNRFKKSSRSYDEIILHFASAPEKNEEKKNHWLKFEYAQDLSNDGKCLREVEIPMITLVQWNNKRSETGSAKFRQAMTQLLPRGEMFRVGGLKMGDLISGLILRAHPGYNRKVLVRPFNAEKSNEELAQIGYPRPNLLAPRLNAEGKPLRLSIWSPLTETKQANLIEKILVDSFAASGIITQVLNDKKMPDKNSLDGAITGLVLDWPEQNYFLDMHSRVEDSALFWRPQDPELDKMLETYALSLTQQKPNFSTLQNIHQRIYDLEPFSIIMQHSACIRVDDNFGKQLSTVLMRDPEWFKKLIEI